MKQKSSNESESKKSRKRTYNKMREDNQKSINIENKNNNNFIIAELYITYIKKKEEDRDIRIINSFEAIKREKNLKDDEDDYKYENEKEIKEKCEIKINDKLIPFNYFYKFNNKGKYEIKYIFKEKVIKADYMFYGCKYLKKINLSNFNTQNVNNMSGMFSLCESLTNIN